MYKQVILIRKDLNLSKGKSVAQGAHASVGAYLNASKDVAQAWLSEGGKKVALYVEDEAQLIEIFQTAKDSNLPAALIIDAGHTEIPAGTKTAVGIGPALEEDVDKLCSDLSLI